MWNYFLILLQLTVVINTSSMIGGAFKGSLIRSLQIWLLEEVISRASIAPGVLEGTCWIWVFCIIKKYKQFSGWNSSFRSKFTKRKEKHNFCNIGKMKNWVSIFERRMKNTILIIKMWLNRIFKLFPVNLTGWSKVYIMKHNIFAKM